MLRRNGLSVTLFSLFILMWVGQFFAGFYSNNFERKTQGAEPLSQSAYFFSSHFWESTFENWESEFLQMSVFVILTTFLYQQGSSESNPLPEERSHKSKAKPRYFVHRPFLRRIYENSLSLALFFLFASTFLGHFFSGLKEENTRRAIEAGLPPLSTAEFLTDATFWFQSLQNWQSEFLSIGVIVVLSIFLRQKNSSQSKEVDSPHSQTGD